MASPASSWTPFPAQPSLTAGDVHLAKLQVAAGARLIPELEHLLSRRERQRADAFHFDTDRTRYVVARGGLRILLARYLGASPAELGFRSNRYGKPFLADSADRNGIRFNVSHSGPLVVYAFARGRRVGVDVELIRSDVSFRDIAARYYSPSEQGFLRRQAPDDQPAAFFAVWTHKEAYMKGRGRGMAIPSQEFSVSVAGEGPTPVDDRACASRPGAWRTMRVEVGEGCAAAVAVEGPIGEFRHFEAASALAAQLSP